MAIACAYCNGEHETPAQVRQCWNDGGRQEVAVADDPIPHPADSLFDAEPPASATRAPVAPRRAAPRPVPGPSLPGPWSRVRDERASRKDLRAI